jgi:hypothetical protein
MKTHEVSSQYPAFNAAQNQEISLSQSPAKLIPSEETEAPILTLPVLGTFGAVMMAILAFYLKELLTQRRKQTYTDSGVCHQHIPCRNCRFFNRNSYLKCAVHPTKVMQQAAIGCSDYWAEDSNKFSQ